MPMQHVFMVDMRLTRRARFYLWLGKKFLRWTKWALEATGVPLKGDIEIDVAKVKAEKLLRLGMKGVK